MGTVYVNSKAQDNFEFLDNLYWNVQPHHLKRLYNPNWSGETSNGDDWRSYVPEEIKDSWLELSPEVRMAVILTAEQASEMSLTLAYYTIYYGFDCFEYASRAPVVGVNTVAAILGIPAENIKVGVTGKLRKWDENRELNPVMVRFGQFRLERGL